MVVAMGRVAASGRVPAMAQVVVMGRVPARAKFAKGQVLTG
jgi:hypothetical protein